MIVRTIAADHVYSASRQHCLLGPVMLAVTALSQPYPEAGGLWRN